MTDRLDTRGLERRQDDWDAGNRKSLWEHRSYHSQERVRVLSNSRQHVQGKSRRVAESKRVADLELKLEELGRSFTMLAKYVVQLQREAVRQPAATAGSPPAPLGENLIEAVTRQIASVSKAYDVPDHGSLVRYFAERPKLAQFLLDSTDEIVKHFEYGPASIVVDDGELVMRIPTQLSPAVAQKRFSAFLRDWWMPKAGVEDKMTLTLNYV